MSALGEGAFVAVRDQSETPFARILGGLVARVPGARAAALVDREGETVDYAGSGAPDEIRIAAAHWRIVLRDVQEQKSLAGTTWLAIDAVRQSFVVQGLPEGYALVVLLAEDAGPQRIERAVQACGTALAKEARWSSAAASRWYPVAVTRDSSDRPFALEVDGGPQMLELLGHCPDREDSFDAAGTGTAPRERAWRVRLAFGVEAMLVCDPSGFWYADEPLDELAAPSPNPRPKSPA